ncbi:MAG: tetratricopeptide repeat protein [Methanobacteriaceae archaeon]|nr:tetratricopeptide repeat protein [Methanobacteriaceae archaeon]
MIKKKLKITLINVPSARSEHIYYFNKLLEDCNRSLEIFPDNGRYWERKADIFYFSGKYEESFKCYDKALNCDVYNKAELISSKAQSLYKLKKYEKAIELFDEALKISNFVYAFKYKGYCLEELNKYDEAIDCYNKYLEIKPKDKEVLSKKSKLNEKIK